MGNQNYAYDISFVSAKKTEGILQPQIVFSINVQNLDLFRERLDGALDRYTLPGDEYLGNYSEFMFSLEDRFGNDKCAFVSCTNNKINFHVELLYDTQARSSAATIWILLCVLNDMLVDEKLFVSEKQQPIRVETLLGMHVDGHPIWGTVYPIFGSWLKQQGIALSDLQGSGNEAIKSPLILQIREDMQETWSVVAPKDLKEYHTDCRVDIARDGRFFFGCFGDACDVAIYPDSLYGDIDKHLVSFGCHNLDIEIQQLTLLSGLATMCGLASLQISQ